MGTLCSSTMSEEEEEEEEEAEEEAEEEKVGEEELTGGVDVVDAGLALDAHGIGGPAEQRAEVELGARRVAQHGDGAVGRGAVARRQLQRLARAVEGPAEGRHGRFGLDAALHFAGQALGGAVRLFLLHPTSRSI